MTALPEGARPPVSPTTGAFGEGLVSAAWRWPLLLLVAVMGALLLLYRETTIGMVAIWIRSETFTHAFLVPPISMWLVWRRRHSLQGFTPTAAPLTLLPMVSMGLLWLLGELAHANSVRQLALVSMLVLSVPLVMGWTVTKSILFPLLYLYFCVPVGEFLLPVLMDWTADFTVAALRMSGVPVYREGMNFQIPSGNWSVVEACSGVRYLIASLMVGTLFAYLNYRSTKRRALFIAVSIVVPIVANWLRAYMIVMLGHLSSNKIAVGVDHLIYGWIFFGVVVMIMFTIGARWSEPEESLSRVNAEVASTGPTVALSVDAAAAGRKSLAMAICAVLSVGVLAVPPTLVDARFHAQVLGEPILVMPGRLPGGWELESVEKPAAWVPRYDNPSVTAHAVYHRDGTRVGVHVYYYRGLSDDRKLISSANQIVRRSVDVGWVPLAPVLRQVVTSDGEIDWRRVQVLMPSGNLGSGQSLTVWHTYWSGGRLTPSEGWAAFHGSLQRLAGRGDDSAAIFLYTMGAPDGGADALLASFAERGISTMQAALQAARGVQ